MPVSFFWMTPALPAPMFQKRLFWIVTTTAEPVVGAQPPAAPPLSVPASPQAVALPKPVAPSALGPWVLAVLVFSIS